MDAPTVEEGLVLASEKLHRKEYELTISPRKHQLVATRRQVQELQTSLEQGEQVIQKASTPAWVPKGLQRAFLFLSGRKDAIARRAADQALVATRLEQLKKDLANMEQDLQLVLVPLTLADEGVVNAYYFKTRRHLMAAIPDSVDPLEHQAREEALDFGTNHYSNAKQVQLVAKKRVDGKLVPAFTELQAHHLDVRVAREIIEEHAKAFKLSEEELGKSAAPNPGS